MVFRIQIYRVQAKAGILRSFLDIDHIDRDQCKENEEGCSSKFKVESFTNHSLKRHVESRVVTQRALDSDTQNKSTSWIQKKLLE